MVLHRLLRRALPRRFRRAHGEDMERVFHERLASARHEGGRGRVLRTWLREAFDVVATGARLRWVDSRDDGRMTMTTAMARWTQDLAAAARSLRRSPAHTLFAVATLALGIGATAALYSALDRVLLNPLDFPDADRIVSVWLANEQMMRSPDDEALRRLEGLEGVFDVLAAARQESVTLSSEAGATPLEAAYIDQELIRLAGVARPVAGRLFTDDDLAEGSPPVVALGESLWRSRFGSDPGIVGRTLRIEGVIRTVVGVFPARLTAPSPGIHQTDLWMPRSGSAPGLEIFARLAPDMTLEQARERVAGVGEADGSASEWSLRLVEAGSLEAGRLVNPVRAVGAAVGLLLLIACVNVANLLLLRADERRRETAVRAALGAGQGRLVRVAGLEAVLLALLGGAVGVGGAAGALAVLDRMVPAELGLLAQLSLDVRVLGATLVTALVTALLFGVVPARRALRLDPAEALTERGGTASRDTAAFRRGLMVVEVALSFTLLVGATQLVHSLARLSGRDTGFASTELIDLRIGLPEWRFPEAESRETALQELRRRLAALPGVTGVTRGNGLPPQTGIFFGVPQVEGTTAEDGSNQVFFGNSVLPGYFATLDQPLRAGRDFTEAERTEGADVVILGRSAAERFFPGGNAVGGRFKLGAGPWSTVVGVADDVLATGSATPPDYAQLYYLASPGSSWTFGIRTATPQAVLPLIRPLVAEFDPEIPVNSVGLVADDYRAGLAKERLVTLILVAFAVVAVVLAAVGLFGVASRVAAQRTREFGIRMSLGADRAGVFRLVFRSGLVTVAAGLVAGAGLTWLGIRLLRSELVGLSASEPLAYGLAGVFLTLVTLAAVAAPARRAARLDPVVALKAD